jgi:hypothetical protein
MRRASVKMSPQWPRSAATSPINTRLCLPPDASSRALDPTTIRRTHLPRHSNPHSRVRGTLRAPSPAGSFLGGFRTTAPGARRSHLDRPSSETLNRIGHIGPCCCVYADGVILLNQKRLRADLVHEDEWELDEMFRILWHRLPSRADFAGRMLAKRFHKNLRRMRPCHGSSKLRSRNAQPKPPP